MCQKPQLRRLCGVLIDEMSSRDTKSDVVARLRQMAIGTRQRNVKSELDLNCAPLLPWTYRHLNRFIRDASGRHLSASGRHSADVAQRREGHAHNRKAARGLPPLGPVTAC